MATYSAADCAKFRARYDEADQALHALMTGTKEVRVRVDAGKEVEYDRANIAELQRYVGYLRDKVAICDGCWPRRLIQVIPAN